MRKCNNCNKEYDETIKGAIQKYCSKKCGRQDYYNSNKEKEKSNCARWYKDHQDSEIEKNKEYRRLNNELFHWYHDKDRYGGMREVILSRDGHKCKACCSSKKIVIHHKDGTGITSVSDKDRINNDIKNLITLCHPCHIILHFWQKRNRRTLQDDEEIVKVINERRDEKENK